MKAYVYMVECGDFIKIGYSANLERRIYSLSSSTPYDLLVVRLWEFECKKMAHMVEQSVHKHLTAQGLNHKLEWYRNCHRQHAEMTIDEKIIELDTERQRLKNRLKKLRPRFRPLQNLAKKEKEIMMRQGKKRTAHKNREEAIRSHISSYKHKKTSEECGIESKVLWRFIYKGSSMGESDLDKCHLWLMSKNHKIKWGKADGAKT